MMLLPTLDDTMRETHVDIIALRHSRVDLDELVDRVNAWADEIRPAVEEDPHRSYTLAEYDETVRALKDPIRERHDFLDGWLQVRDR